MLAGPAAMPRGFGWRGPPWGHFDSARPYLGKGEARERPVALLLPKATSFGGALPLFLRPCEDDN